MPKTKRFIKQPSKFYRSLVATVLLANGIFQFVTPVLAEGTAAGQPISNTATATYEDPNAPGTTINATSNTVTVTVAEVAGITVVATGVPTDSTPGDAIKVGDTLTYTYTVTNVGNDPTKFRIPNLATTTGPAAVSGNLQYFNGTNWVDITGAELITGSIPVNGTVQVRVNVVVQPGANANDIITVQLGDTPGNAQNVARVNNGGDVYTVDNPDGSAGETAGVPANGTREASAKQQSTVGAVAKNLALATLLKTQTNYVPGVANTLSDDQLTYGLSLRVEGNDVTGQGITPQPLAGYTGISVDGDSTTPRILVSDVIPTGTVLKAAPTAPSGWTAVYSTDNTSKPNAVTWTTTAPTTTAQFEAIKRVGFVKTTSQASDYIPVNTTLTGFSITVGLPSTGTPPTTLSINNIAQLVAQTPGIGGLPVYDESGDQNPSNYNGPLGNMTPGTTDANNDGVPDASVADNTFNGVADPATQGVDASNDNTGSGPGGEVNVLVINAAAATSVLNGPLNAPGATGPDGTTATDFTNKSSFIPAGTSPGSKIDPQAVGFSNTVQNNGTSPGSVTLVPTVPANKLDLPEGTKVTITYGGNSAVYIYSQSGAGSFTITGSPISITNVAAGASIGYGVEVDLPANTKLSTDTLTDYSGDTEWGYPVPITATIGTVSNTTIDRVFTGYLQLIKVSRILQGSGEAVVGTQGDFESTPAYVNFGPNGVLGGGDDVTIDPNSTVADVPRTPTPGNIIEYQIRYKNISNVQAGVGNVILNADKVVITEDGTAGNNNWAKDNDLNGIIDTSNVTNPQAVDSNSGTITFFPSVNQSGTTAATDVTKYVDAVNGLVIPQEQGTFTFQRKVN
ncbi:hypothetical protein HCG51_14285 [Tolypothrix sp. PCC 7910]|uniref:beta strand repeat-containing protein n=1 Tax=Tolypothrix sp. PCC 7910 TaxID=2099387 RepID=UPI0014278579|nr:hypothetical protein [Tolypothrix sp. PCC 7910]QIR37766.1 hypothetical protein HCG51_14285 [Tolypothrix sp. PCC 7910]